MRSSLRAKAVSAMAGMPLELAGLSRTQGRTGASRPLTAAATHIGHPHKYIAPLPRRTSAEARPQIFLSHYQPNELLRRLARRAPMAA